MDQDETWQASRLRPRSHSATSGPSSPPPKGHSPPQFSAHVYCGKQLYVSEYSMEVGLGPGDVVLDGAAALLKGTQPPVFGPCLLWPNSWMDKDATWYPSRPQPRPHCVRRGPSSLRERGTAALPSFRPMSIVAMVAHLSNSNSNSNSNRNGRSEWITYQAWQLDSSGWRGESSDGYCWALVEQYFQHRTTIANYFSTNV